MIRDTFGELIDDLRAIDVERGSSPLSGKIRSQIRMMRRPSLQSHKYNTDAEYYLLLMFLLYHCMLDPSIVTHTSFLRKKLGVTTGS